MNKLKELLRLKFDAKLSLRQIALSLSLSVGVISKYLKRADDLVSDGGAKQLNKLLGQQVDEVVETLSEALWNVAQ